MEKVKWGVLGTAGIAHKHVIPAMKEADNCELYAIAGRSAEKAEQFRNEFGFEKAYGSLEELLDDPEVQAVYIPLPNDMHKEWVIKAAEAKKDILCEKPLAPSEKDAKEMFEAAEKNGVHLMEAFAYLHSPYMEALKGELDTGVLGAISFIDSEFMYSDYEVTNIRMQKDRYGGALYDLGCYNISQILYLTGEMPENVSACASYSEGGVDVLTSSILEMPDGVRAMFACGMVLPTEQYRHLDRFEIHGDRGFIRSRTPFNAPGELNFLVNTEEGQKVVSVKAPNNYLLEIVQFGKVILDGENPLVSKEFSLKVARVIDAVARAIGY